MNPKPINIVQLAAALLIIASVWIALVQTELGDLGKVDLLQYWAAAKALFADKNPYDSLVLAEIQQSVGPVAAQYGTVIMWNPPLVFPFILFLAWLEFNSAVATWLVLSCMVVLSACMLAGRIKYIASSTLSCSKSFEKFFLYTFYPVALSLYYGQISHFLLLGLVGFLLCASILGRGATSTSLGGAFLSLTIVKPHLLFLLYIWIVIQSMRKNSWQTLAGLAIGTFVLGAVPLIFDFEIYSRYLDHLRAPPIYWKTPTAGSWLQSITETHSPIIRGLPTLFSAAVFTIWCLFSSPKHSERIELAFLLIPMSLLFSPYGWVYDQMLLLPTVIWILRSAAFEGNSGRQLWICGTVLIAANFVVALAPETAGQELFVWYPMLVFCMAWMRFRALAPVPL